jgi:hypothetical protein
MSAGLQCFDGTGFCYWDTNDYTCRTLGYVDVGTGVGSITDERFTTGTPWAFPVMSANVNTYTSASSGMVDVNFWATAPIISFSGNQMTWNRDASKNPGFWTNPACRIYYGVR